MSERYEGEYSNVLRTECFILDHALKINAPLNFELFESFPTRLDCYLGRFLELLSVPDPCRSSETAHGPVNNSTSGRGRE